MNIHPPFPIPIAIKYGLDAYNFVEPLGGGCGYSDNYDQIAKDLNLDNIVHTYYYVSDDLYLLQTTLNNQLINPLKNNAIAMIFIIDNSPNGNYSPEINCSNSKLPNDVSLPFEIPSNTYICGSRGYYSCEGALFYTTDKNVPALFKVIGTNVRITSLRIAGMDLTSPDYTPIVDSDSSCAILATQSNLEVENCEIYGWTEASIYIKGDVMINPLYKINIHHCYIHHNIHSTYGYGIALSRCNALIECNIFDYNRNSIIGTGESYTSFEAKYNLILPNAIGNAFEMHHNNKLAYFDSYVKIHFNSFWLRSHTAIYIVGMPFVAGDIIYNIFAGPRNHLTSPPFPDYIQECDAIFIAPGVSNLQVHSNEYWKYVIPGLCGINAYNDWYDLYFGGPLGGGCGYYVAHPSITNHIYVYNIQTLQDALTLYNPVTNPKGWQLNYTDIHGNRWCLIEFYDGYNDFSPIINFPNTTNFPILIPANTIFYGYRGYVDSQGICSEGALLYTTDKVVNPLFQINGENVRITGLRIAGPDQSRQWREWENTHNNQHWSQGIYTNFDNLELDNCELYGWTHTPLRVDGFGLPSIIANINIHHNYIHHNRGGFDSNGANGGYGMSLGYCMALIEANIFDYNRHSIEATGEPGTSYEARYNLQLNNAISHAFDMHPYPRPNTPKNISGEKILIHHNSFWKWDLYVIGIDNPPSDSVEIYYNFFAQKLSQGQAPTSNNDDINPQSGSNPYQPLPPNIHIYDNNIFGK